MWRTTSPGPVILSVEVLVPTIDRGEAAVLVARYSERIAFSGIGRRLVLPVFVRSIEVTKSRDPIVLVRVARSDDVPQAASQEIADQVTRQVLDAIRDQAAAPGYA